MPVPPPPAQGTDAVEVAEPMVEPRPRELTALHHQQLPLLACDEPAAVEPVAAVPVATELAAVEPAVIEPPTAGPAGAERVVAEPATPERAVAEPRFVGAIVAEPTAIEAVVAEAIVAEPAAIEAVAAEPAVIEIVVTEPATAEHDVHVQGTLGVPEIDVVALPAATDPVGAVAAGELQLPEPTEASGFAAAADIAGNDTNEERHLSLSQLAAAERRSALASAPSRGVRATRSAPSAPSEPPRADAHSQDAQQLKERMMRASRARRRRRPDLIAETVDPALPGWYEPGIENPVAEPVTAGRTSDR